jgi:6-phosphogluconate dehydrogenase (decarboxylating)
MQLGMLGVGRIGGNIVRRLSRQGHQCVVFDQNLVAIKALVGKGVTGDRNGGDPRVERGDMPVVRAALGASSRWFTTASSTA